VSEFEKIVIKNDLGPRETLEFVLRNLDVTTKIDYEENPERNRKFAATAISDPGTFIHARNEGSIIADRHYKKLFGFVASMSIVLDPFREKTRKATQDWLIRVALMLAKQTNWDFGVVFRNGAIVVLKYISNENEMVLNELYGIWTPERLEMVDIPYRMEEIPIL
jgi:hypothetical protein